MGKKSNFTIEQLKQSKCANLNQNVIENFEEKKTTKHKYGAKMVEVPTFEGKTRIMSKKQAKRYYELMVLVKADEIFELKLEVEYVLLSNDEVKGKSGKFCYRADFRYKLKDGTLIVEDTKGMKTQVYLRKKRLMKQIYGIEIFET